MNKLLLFFVLLTLISCSSTNAVNFTFYDSSEKSYQVSALKEIFNEVYDVNYQPNILLIKTRSIDNPEYVSQLSELREKIDAELMKLIYVYICEDNKCNEGYHTYLSKIDSLQLPKSKFSITIINEQKELVISSESVLTASQIVNYL